MRRVAGSDTQICSIARTLELVGERWSLLIIRDAFLGKRRFDEFQQSLGVARNVLSDRPAGSWMPASSSASVTYEYRLTDKGRELHVALLALMHFGDRHLAPHGPPRIAEHSGCGGAVVEQLVCSKCNAVLTAGDVHTRSGPGLRPPAGR